MSKWIKYCIRKATERETDQRYRLHAVLIRGGSVQAQGWNLPVTDIPGRIVNPKAPEYIGLHAELACLRSATEDQVKRSVLYVGGVNPTGGLIKTRPCCYCLQDLESSGLSRVVYHTEDGIAESIAL